MQCVSEYVKSCKGGIDKVLSVEIKRRILAQMNGKLRQRQSLSLALRLDKAWREEPSL